MSGRSVRRIGAAASFCLALLIGSAASAEEGTFSGQFGALAVGQVHTLSSETHIWWAGAFSGAFFDDAGEGLIHRAFVTCPATNEIDLAANTSKASGHCIIMDGAGSQIHLTWACEGTAAGCAGTGVYLSGTGRWEGLTGTAVFEAAFGPILGDGQPTWARWEVNYILP
ncbi:MAG: hypothetical protein KIS96_10295 [Bauldia sp.]|nr:hypothetical protein [Bauldia sp.]